jgi:hypothetical protein
VSLHFLDVAPTLMSFRSMSKGIAGPRCLHITTLGRASLKWEVRDIRREIGDERDAIDPVADILSVYSNRSAEHGAVRRPSPNGVCFKFFTGSAP